MSKFYMLVGLPGSGKSTEAEKINAKVFSSDKLREELYGDENIQGDNTSLFAELHKRIKKCLIEGNDCIYDATNINAKRRKAFLQEIKKIDCEKICIFVATDFDLCIERNNNRDRKVPYNVIKKMYLTIDIPQYREGWDNIIVKRNLIEDKEYNIFKYMDYLNTLNHENPHHLLTVGYHIQAVTKHIINEYKLTFAGDIDRLKRLTKAAFYHDIGKGFTKTFINTKGEETEVAHYYGHEHVSAYLYCIYEKEEDFDLYVADLIGLHMRMYCQSDNKEKTYQKIKNMVGKREFEDLCILHEADVICS